MATNDSFPRVELDGTRTTRGRFFSQHRRLVIWFLVAALLGMGSTPAAGLAFHPGTSAHVADTCSGCG